MPSIFPVNCAPQRCFSFPIISFSQSSDDELWLCVWGGWLCVGVVCGGWVGGGQACHQDERKHTTWMVADAHRWLRRRLASWLR